MIFLSRVFSFLSTGKTYLISGNEDLAVRTPFGVFIICDACFDLAALFFSFSKIIAKRVLFATGFETALEVALDLLFRELIC